MRAMMLVLLLALVFLFIFTVTWWIASAIAAWWESRR